MDLARRTDFFPFSTLDPVMNPGPHGYHDQDPFVEYLEPKHQGPRDITLPLETIQYDLTPPKKRFYATHF